MCRYIILNLYINIDIDILFKLHKRYSWPSIEKCPACHAHRLWGHGYVARYLEHYQEPCYLKRYRCPHCHKVFIVRPKTHYRRFLVAIETIVNCLLLMVTTGRKSKEFSRQRQQYWMHGARIQAARFSNCQLSTVVLNALVYHNIIVPTHSLKYFEIAVVHCAAYLSFAVTKAHESG